MSMRLRKVDHRTWVNVGDGNVTSVVDLKRPSNDSGPPIRRVLINTVGGGQLEIPGHEAEGVVKALENVGGFGQ